MDHNLPISIFILAGSLVRPKVVRSVHYCPTTKKTMERKYTDMTSLEAFPTSAAYPTKVWIHFSLTCKSCKCQATVNSKSEVYLLCRMKMATCWKQSTACPFIKIIRHSAYKKCRKKPLQDNFPDRLI